MNNRATQIASDILARQRRDDFAGYDPFDGLNSRLLKATPLYNVPLVRLAWLQFFKLSPLNLRPLLGVPKARNPKGIALFILGMLQDYARSGDAQLLNEATRLGDWLLQNRCDVTTWGHSCWGYHFDWQARAFYVPVGKPNIITTTYVARALYALGQRLNEQRFVDAAIDSARFMQKHLLTRDADGEFFAYIPGEGVFVHNASLWGAAMCVAMGKASGDSGMIDNALAVARRSARAQRDDGAWVYGARSHHQFIDGFHTGYNLEALFEIDNTLGTAEFSSVIAKGLDYYRTHFFLVDGMPKYYNDKIYPIDMHSSAQAIITLLKVGGTRDDLALADKVMNWTLDNMYLPAQQTFRYQKLRWYNNNISYVRWTQAWAYYALAFYNNFPSSSVPPGSPYHPQGERDDSHKS